MVPKSLGLAQSRTFWEGPTDHWPTLDLLHPPSQPPGRLGWWTCLLQAPCVHRRSLPRSLWAWGQNYLCSATVTSIRGPACSTSPEFIEFLCPTLLVLWGSSLKFPLSPNHDGCLSQPLEPQPLSDNPTAVIQRNSRSGGDSAVRGPGHFCF